MEKNEMMEICDKLDDADFAVQKALGDRADLHNELIYKFCKDGATHLLQLNRSAIRRHTRMALR